MLFGLFLLGLIPIMMVADALLGDTGIDPDGDFDDATGDTVSFDAADTGGVDALLEAAPEDYVATDANMPLVLDDFEPGSDNLTLHLAPDQMDIAEAETETGGVAIVEGGENLLVEFPNLDWVPVQDISIVVEDPETGATVEYELVEMPTYQDPVLAAPEPDGNDPAPLFASEEDLSNISDPTVDEIDGPTPEELDDEALEQEPEQNSTGKEIVHKIKDFVPGKNKLAVEISADPAAAPPEVTVIPTENGLGSQIFVGGWLVVVLEDLPDVAPSDIILETVSQATGSNQNPHGEG